jgi:hypothetical protein
MSNISIAVTADTASLEAQLALAKAAVRDFNSELSSVARQVNAAGEAVDSGLVSSLQNLAGQASAAKARVSEIKEAMGGAGGVFGGIQKSLEGALSPLTALTGGLGKIAEIAMTAFAVDRIAEWAKSVAEGGAQVLHLSQQLGMSTADISKLGYTAAAMGLDIGSVGTMFDRLEKNMVLARTGTGQQQAAFQALGISASELKNLSLDQVMDRIADSFSRAADGPDKTAIAIALMGRTGAQMIPVFDQGRAGLEKFNEEAEASGVVLHGTMAQGMEDSTIAMSALGQSTKGLGISLFELFKPAIDAIVNGLTEFIRSMNDSVRQGGALGEALKVLVAGFNGILLIIADLSTGFQILWQTGAAAIEALNDAVHGRFSQAMQDVQDRLHKAIDAANQFKETFIKLTSNTGSDLGQTSADDVPGPQKPKLDASALNTQDQITQLEAFKEKLEEVKAAMTEAGDSQLAIQQREVAMWREEVNNASLTAKEKLQAEQSYAQARIALYKAGAAEQIRDDEQAVQAARKGSQARITALQKEVDDAKRLYGAKSQEAMAAENKLTQAIQEAEQQRIQIEKQAADQSIKVADDNYKLQEAQLKLSVTQRKMTVQDETKALIDAENQRYEAVKAALEKILADEKLTDQQRTQVMDQLVQKQTQHLTNLTNINTRDAQQSARQWQQFSSSVGNSFASAVGSVLQGTATIGGAFQKMASQMVLSWIEAIVRMIAEWAVLEVVTEGNAGSLVQFMSGGGAGKGGGGLGGIFGSFASGAWNLPSDMLAMVHQGEMIIPSQDAPIARAFFSGQPMGTVQPPASLPAFQTAANANSVTTAAAAGGGGTVVNLHLSAIDGPSARSFLQNNAGAIVSQVATQVRNGNLALRPSSN